MGMWVCVWGVCVIAMATAAAPTHHQPVGADGPRQQHRDHVEREHVGQLLALLGPVSEDPNRAQRQITSTNWQTRDIENKASRACIRVVCAA